ncbi:MAG: outer membrane lipoprotein carrier protein LolA [Thermoanaerobaculia bacterium]
MAKSHRSRVKFLVLGVLFAGQLQVPAVSSAASDKVPDPQAPGLTLAQRSEALVDRIRFEQKRLRTLEADFVQYRVSEFLAAPEESRGTFSYSAPDLVRWDYTSPKPVSLVIREDEMVTWYRDLGKAERVKVGRASSQVFRYLNASGSLDTLMKYFAVTFAFPGSSSPDAGATGASPAAGATGATEATGAVGAAGATTGAAGDAYRLDLAPRFARIRKRLAAMSLWIDPKVFLPARVRYVEANGDTTEYRFDHLRLNGEVPPSRFELAIPKEVEIRVVDLDRARNSGH